MIPIPRSFFCVSFTMARLARTVTAGLPYHVGQMRRHGGK